MESTTYAAWIISVHKQGKLRRQGIFSEDIRIKQEYHALENKFSRLLNISLNNRSQAYILHQIVSEQRKQPTWLY